MRSFPRLPQKCSWLRRNASRSTSIPKHLSIRRLRNGRNISPIPTDATVCRVKRLILRSSGNWHRKNRKAHELDIPIIPEETIVKWLSEKKISKEELLIKRFATLYERLGINADPVATENHYRSQLGKGCQVIHGALDVCRKLRKDYKLYVITNGVATTQHSRLEGSGVAELMDGIFISDEIGYDKPDVRFFEYVQKSILGFEKNKALVIGDSLFSDIRGGVGFGLDTCYLNVYNEKNTSEIQPTYEIQDIVELLELL